jgi:hypothetical protein
MADAAHNDQAQPGGTTREADPLMEQADSDAPGSRAGRFLAGLLGAITLVGGLTWILINLQAPEPLVDLATGVVLAAGGLVLLMPHRVRLPGRAAWITGTAAAVLGSAAGLLVHTVQTCCMYAYVEQRGFPFTWLSHSASAADPATARSLALGQSWHVDVPSLVMSGLVWAWAGILVLAIVSGARRKRR